jgi:hypothetical protein
LTSVLLSSDDQTLSKTLLCQETGSKKEAEIDMVRSEREREQVRERRGGEVTL